MLAGKGLRGIMRTLSNLWDWGGIIRTLSNLWDGAFCEISWRLKAAKYFRKKIHLKCMTGFWILCNWTRTQNHLVLKRTLNHLAKVAKWLSVRLKTKWFWFRVQLQSLNLKITRGDRIHSVHRFTVQTSWAVVKKKQAL